jgi:hypothetical protein
METILLYIMAKKLMRFASCLLLTVSITACNNHTKSSNSKELALPASKKIYTSIKEIPLPSGYERMELAAGAYGSFLRNQRLQQDTTVYLYNGAKKNNQSAQFAVLSMDVGTRDLQQCADAAMRLYAEHLYAQQQYDKISFTLTNGFDCRFSKYAAGYRVVVNGNKTTWVLQAKPDSSYAVFRKYLDLVFTYAGTRSLHGQMKSIAVNSMQPGDVFIQTGDPYGHAVTVMDMAVNKQTKDTIFMLSQSYMPAQNIHVLVNPSAGDKTPWYSKAFTGKLFTPEWTFNRSDLKRF